MRIRLPMRRAVFLLAAFVFALIALLPLRLVLGWLSVADYGLAAREAQGSIWFGRLVEARLGGVPLGDLDARLNLIPLITGRARIDLARAGEGAGDAGFAGALSITRHSFGADDVTARLSLGQRFAPLPVIALDLRDVSVRFRDGLCDTAEGLVKAEVAGDVAGVALPGGLTGNARCEAGALLLPLASQSGMEGLALKLRSDGRYRAELRVSPSEATAREALLASGFVATAKGFEMAIEGRM